MSMFFKKALGLPLGSTSVSELQSQILAKVWPLAGDVPLNTPMELMHVKLENCNLPRPAANLKGQGMKTSFSP